jgi:hypothetical protein
MGVRQRTSTDAASIPRPRTATLISLLCHRRPRHGNEDSRCHSLDQRHSLMDRITPSFNRPALLAARSSLLKIRELPQVVDCVEISNLHEPSSDAFHDLPTSFQATPPVGLPFEQVSRMQLVRTKLKYTAQLPGRRRRPEREFLHERDLLGVDQRVETTVEVRKLGMVRYRVP